MMISICAASALFAADDYYLANDNGVLKQVIKVNGVYKYADGSGYPDRNIFILSKLFDTQNNTGSMFMGEGANVMKGINNIAIGKNAQVKLSLADQGDSLAIGHFATATETNTTAIGAYSLAAKINDIAIGPEAQALGGNSVAIGKKSQATDTDAIAIGNNAQATINNAIAIGQNSEATHDHAVAFGIKAIASRQFSQAIGTSAESKGSYSNAIGFEAKSSGENALAFGYRAEAQGLNSLAFGTISKASGANSNAIGLRANASGENSNAIGVNSFATGKNSIAIGSGGTQYAQGEGSIAIGSAAYTFDKHSISIGTLAQTLGNGYSIAIGNQSLAKKENTIAIGSKAKALDDYASAIGTSAEADNSATALGYQAKAKGTYSTAFGTGAKALGRSSVAIGTYSNIAESAVNSIAIGTINEMKHENSVAIGYATTAQGKNSVALGYNAKIFGAPNGMALGTDAQSRTSNSVALGYGSWAERGSLSDDNQLDVYLIEKGGNNKINKDGEVAKTVAKTMSAVSVGNSDSSNSAGIFTRQIINVAAGSEDSDAVNVAQLKALNNEINNKGLKFETNYISSPATDTIISKKLGETLSIIGGESIENRIGIDDFSGENIATSNNDGKVGLMMKRKPKFDGISFVKNSTDNDPIKIEKSDDTTLTFLSKNNEKIKLTNIAAGTADTDAVNVSQLIKSSEENRIKYFSVKSDKTGGGSNYDNDGAKGQEAVAIGPNAIVETNAASAIALGDGAKVEANAASAIAIGHKANAQKTNSIAIGSNTKSGDSSVAIGLGSKTGEGVIDKASYNKIKKEFESVKNKYKKAEKLNNQEKMAEFGKRRDELEELLKTYDARYEYNGKLITKAEYDKLSQADKKKAIIKYMSSTMYKNSVAIGHDAQALANDAVAIGNGAKVIVDGSKKIVAGGGVAIGQGSVSNAREDKDLKGYRPKAFSIDENSNAFKNSKSAWIATNQPFAVGDDNSRNTITRQITGVAAGTKDTDAVNVAQLKQVGFKAAGDTGIGTIQNENDENDILNIKTNGSWENKQTKIVYTGKNLETKFTPHYFDNNLKTRVYSTVEIAMTDTPRFKSITIANDNVTKNQEDKSPIELKKFDDDKTIGFAGKGNSTTKLTNLTDGEVNATSTDAVTGKQLHKLANIPLKFADNNNKIIDRKLGDTLRISGGQEINANIKEDDFTIGKNIGVFKKDNENLTVALAKNLQDINSLKGQGNNSAKITLGGENNNSISVNGGKITNLADATDKTDAVNKGQLDEVAKNSKAAINKGLNFQGDDKQNINKKLGDTLSITGGITDKAKLSSNNIGVYKNKDGSLTVALSKNLTGLESVTTGDTVINNSGVTIKDGTDDKVTLTKDGLTIKNGPSVKADGINAGNKKITNVADGDISANSTDAVTGKQLHNITNSLNSKVSDVTGKNNIKVESKGTEKIVSLKENIDLTNNGSIKFGDGKTEITKDKITSKDLVAKGDKQVTISGDKGTVEGLTNTTWDKNNIVENRAATEGQLQSLQNNLENNLNNTIGTTLGSYKIKGDDGVEHSIYDNKTLTTKGDTNIKTKATADGNLDIKLSKNLDLKDGSITLNNAKLDEDGLKVGDDVKITKDTIQNGDVKLTKDGLDNGDKKITNVADGVNDNDAATVRQIRHAVASAGSVKESDKKDKWAKKRPEAKGKNSVSIAGGSTDGGRNNTVSVGSKGNKRTISNVAPGVLNSDAATVGQLKAGLNNVHGKLDEYKKDSRAGTASAMAIGNLPQSTIPGKGMVSLGGGFYDGESAMAIGLSKMSDDGKWVVKGSASYDSQENAGAAVSVGFHF